MGFFSFFKKKEKDVSSNDLSSLNTDLPSISGGDLSLPSLEETFPSGNNINDNNINTPLSDNAFSEGAEKLNDINENNYSDELPSFNDSYVDEHDLREAADQNVVQNTAFESFNENKNDDKYSENKLLLSGSRNNEDYEPYHEEKIEPPRAEDFLGKAGSDLKLPSAEELTIDSNNMSFESKSRNYTLPEITDEDLSEHSIPEDVPYDVFIRGSDYGKIFNEINFIKKTLAVQDEKISQVIETFKKEESVLNTSKENMESLYKRMLLIDKKVFV
ncbi:MAG: hypothetical protein QXK76_01515 [Candidatus Woesearchaeota archaeon]